MMNNTFPVIYAVSDSTSISKTDYERLYSHVSEERKKRAQRFLRFEDSCRTIIAERLLQYALKKSSGILLQSVTLVENQWKKPMIEGSDINFNLTHSGTWVMCIIDTYEAGIDVERVKSIDFGIVPRFFSKLEQDIFSRCKTDTDRQILFATLWVLKESYIKAIGRGLYCPLDSFSVLPGGEDEIVLERDDPSLPHKHFKLYNIGDTYRCAICCSTPKFARQITMVSIEELIGC